MRAQILLPMSIALTVASFGLMKIRLKDIINEEKRAKFQDVKLRVTGDVLQEYEKEKQDTLNMMEKAAKDKDELEKAINAIQSGDSKKTELDTCTSAKTTMLDEITSLEEQLKTLEAETAKEKTAWEGEVTALKEKLSATSPICNYLKPGSSVQGICPEKKEEPKAEAPKPEEKKEEAPKPEEKKEEAPKPEEKKEKEPPKQEEKKAEEPKQEAPKQEEPKQEAPKPEEPKQEAPKPEEQKPEAPKQ